MKRITQIVLGCIFLCLVGLTVIYWETWKGLAHLFLGKWQTEAYIGRPFEEFRRAHQEMLMISLRSEEVRKITGKSLLPTEKGYRVIEYGPYRFFRFGSASNVALVVVENPLGAERVLYVRREQAFDSL